MNTYYCKKCRKYFECNHKEPELVTAKCPLCAGNLTLMQGCIADVTRKLGLSKSEISNDKVSIFEELK